ncbi:hypothetical protein B0H17DRAFT_850773, partial [Mycena rosella]
NIDPQLYTPSKHMRMMTGAVAGISGSFLVGPSKVTSQIRIPAPVLEGPPALAVPNWDHLTEPDNAMEELMREELVEYAMKMKGDLRNSQQQIRARDVIIESAHTTIVVQNLFVEKQSQALHVKETKKKNKREILPMDSFGCHLTNPEFIAAKVEAERLRDVEIVDKAKRAEDQEVAKAMKDNLKQWWEQVKADHATTVELWKEKCEILTADGVLKKNLPKKPVRPLKPKPP